MCVCLPDATGVRGRTPSRTAAGCGRLPHQSATDDIRNRSRAGVADAEWLRRVTLDLAGRIPSSAEVEQFRSDARNNKREVAVDRLLNSPDYAYHERNFLDNMLQSQYDGDREWRAWLLRSIREGRSWQEMFRTIMTGNDDNPDERPALAFLKRRANDIDAMTNDTSRLFFGVSINCAQCHDHPLLVTGCRTTTTGSNRSSPAHM
jgi:hypothetical protein